MNLKCMRGNLGLEPLGRSHIVDKTSTLGIGSSRGTCICAINPSRSNDRNAS